MYYGFYHCADKLKVVEQQNIALIGEVVDKLNSLGEEVVFLGDAVGLHENFFTEYLKVSFCTAPAHLNRSKAASVGYLGMQYFKEGKIQDAKEHLPDYLRASQAERELQEKLQSGKGN